jgi:NADH-quinone oxidoreductase subunit L
MEHKALLGIVLFPLLGALVNGLLGRGAAKEWQVSRPTAHLIACMSVAASFLLAVFCFAKLVMMHGAGEAHAVLQYTAYEWFELGARGQSVPVNVSFLMDELSGVMTLVVTGIGLLIHIYSTGYMSEEPSYARFFSYLNLFTASMLILVLGSSLPIMFVGWEGVGLCSYLLIGFWWENPAYAAAGRKAFVANRIGDFGVLLGMFLLLAAFGSFEFEAINAAVGQAGVLERSVTLMGMPIPMPALLTIATLCLFLGCTGKSAQIPLFVWLPDAMAGPTPVSALIHAATMVTSGLYLICRMSPVFALAPTTMAIIAVIGALTALLAATIGCVQNDIKKVLAYSTVSQLGFMFAGAGCGAFAASFFHVYTHAFFKACLFLGAGSVMHAVGAHGDADIRRLGGLRKYLPHTHWTFLVSCLAIAGVPGFSGFFSKDELLVGALSAGDYLPNNLGTIVFAILVLAATMTAFYMFRLYFMTFAGEYRGGPEHGHGHDHAPAPDAAHAAEGEHAHGHATPHESPAAMTVPLMILGLGAIVAGYAWVGLLHYEPWVHWLEPALGSIEAEHKGALIAAGAGLAAAVVGIGLAYSWYAKPGHPAPARLQASFPALHAFLMDKWRVDELYDATILALSRTLATVSAGVDKFVVDGLLAKASALSVQGLGFAATRVQNGLVQSYAAVMAAGVLGVTVWFAVPHAELEITKQEDSSIELSVSPGLGYSYAWDFDGDEKPDGEFSTETTASHAYVPSDFEEGVVIVLEPFGYARGLEQSTLLPGKRLLLSPRDLGPHWQREPEDTTPPVLELTQRGVEVRANGARVRREGKTLPKDEKIELGRGDHVDIGGARITVASRARSAVIVRNAFGVERRHCIDVTVPDVQERPAVQVLKVAEVGP